MIGRFFPSPVDQVDHDPNGPPPSLHGHYLLHSYYGAVRPCSLFRYFRPRGSSACAFSLGTTERRVDRRNLTSSTGSPGAVTRPRLPQNVACRFPALRSSEGASQRRESW